MPREELFDSVDEIFRDDLSKNATIMDRSTAFYNAGAKFANEITDRIRSTALNSLVLISRERGATFSRDELMESDAFYEVFNLLADSVLDGMETAWPRPVRN